MWPNVWFDQLLGQNGRQPVWLGKPRQGFLYILYVSWSGDEGVLQETEQEREGKGEHYNVTNAIIMYIIKIYIISTGSSLHSKSLVNPLLIQTYFWISVLVVDRGC